MLVNDKTGPTIQELSSQLDSWVGELMNEWEPSSTKIADSCVVRDPIHAFIRLYPHEIEIINTPLLQRLRHISQNGLAERIYPGMRHSRFEHSIGVLHIAQLMMDSIFQSTGINPATRLHVRLAALLHDVGHVLFSHMGEDAMEDCLRTDIKKIWEEPYCDEPRFFHKIKIGEILSFLIITTKSYQETIREKIFQPIGYFDGEALSTIDMEDVGRVILGKTPKNLPVWASDIINGSFDADKLDYIMRDCHYSGVKSEVDSSRLILSLRVVDEDVGEFGGALAVTGNSLNYLEQILLAKLTLYVSVYHHHKVRSIENMFKTVFDELPSSSPEIGRLRKPQTFVEFLELNEFDFWSRGRRTPEVREMVNDLYYRRLLKRCLVLDRTTTRGERTWQRLFNLSKELQANPKEAQDIRDLIYKELPESAKFRPNQLVIDIPSPPDVDEEAQNCPVLLGPKTVDIMSNLMPVDDWVRTYIANKLRGHVFYVSDLNARRHVAGVAEDLLRERYKIELTPLARSIALKE